MTGSFSLMLEIVLAALLLVTILYCWRLDQRLKTLRSGKDGMLQAARELQQSVAQAEAAVLALRRSADAAGKDLQGRIDEARAVAAAGREEPGLRRRMSL
jgi:uncharacterized protein YlxW (UPF0749 family)